MKNVFIAISLCFLACTVPFLEARAEPSVGSELPPLAEEQLKVIRKEYFGNSLISYKVFKASAERPGLLLDINHQRIALAKVPSSGSGRYIYYPLRGAALLLDGSSFIFINQNGVALDLTSSLNPEGSELTYNYKNGSSEMVGGNATASVNTGTTDSIGFRTGEHLRSDILTHSRFVLNQVAPDVKPVYEVYVSLVLRSKSIFPRTMVPSPTKIIGFGISELKDLKLNAANCKIENSSNLLEKGLSCPRVNTVFSTINNTIELTLGKQLDTLVLGTKCGADFSVDKLLFFGSASNGILNENSFYGEAVSGNPTIGTKRLQTRCVDFGGCLTEHFKIMQVGSFGDSLPNIVSTSKMVCRIKPSDESRISIPTRKFEPNTNKSKATIDLAQNDASSIDTRTKCLSDLECYLRPKMFKFSGAVQGLKGKVRVTIAPESKQLLSLSKKVKKDGPFILEGELPEGARYRILLSQPKKQICTASSLEGVVFEADVTNLQVTCIDK